MLAVVAPGQGAQAPGMLADWLEVATDSGSVADRLQWWSTVVSVDLVAAGTSADAEAIRDTAVAQPLLVAAGLASAEALRALGSDVDLARAGVMAGHSVGELTAAALAGSLAAETALTLARERGRAMAAAADVRPTGMTAVLGGEPDVVTEHLARLGLTAANCNGAGQVVAAGTSEALTRLAADPPPGTRLRALPVAGAFHTEHMASAESALATLCAQVPVRDPAVPLLGNADGHLVTAATDLVQRLVRQVTRPVRWDRCLTTMRDLGVTGLLEIAPGGTLTAIARRELRGVDTVALRTPEDLTAARDLVAAHAAPHTVTDDTPAWRLVVAPAAGTFHAQPTTPGTTLDAGSNLGQVSSRRDATPVSVRHAGVLIEWLAEDGDPVSAGQPLARLHPEPTP